MKKLIFKTSESGLITFQRVLLGLVLLGHGLQKLFGLFGGYGFTGTMNYFTQTLGIPWIIGFSVIIIETAGSICLVLGLATRIWSSLMVGLFIGIILMVHLQNGFFMNWFGNLKGEGFEYFLLALGLAVSLVVKGGGKYSIDSLLQVGQDEKNIDNRSVSSASVLSNNLV